MRTRNGLTRWPRNWRRSCRGGSVCRICRFRLHGNAQDKTLEVFGKAREVMTLEGVKKVEHQARHTYTMRQAIAEGFILDVLQNYTTYSTYFELLENAKAARLRG